MSTAIEMGKVVANPERASTGRVTPDIPKVAEPPVFELSRPPVMELLRNGKMYQLIGGDPK